MIINYLLDTSLWQVTAVQHSPLPYFFSYVSACNRTCQNGGTLNEGNCTCDCADGYSGDTCESECTVWGAETDSYSYITDAYFVSSTCLDIHSSFMTFCHLREVFILLCMSVFSHVSISWRLWSVGLNKAHSTERAGEQLDWHTGGMVDPSAGDTSM